MRNWIIIILLVLAAVAAAIMIFTPNVPPQSTSQDFSQATTSTITQATTPMIITSPSFEDGTKIPAKFTCSGGNINPELGIQNVPENTKALALIVDDPDAPSGTFTHWSVWNIDPGTTVIKEESVPPGSVEGTNSYGHTGWRGPCPQVPGPAHHYHFKLYALDATLNNGSGAIPAEVEAEIAKHAIAKAELIGIYP